MALFDNINSRYTKSMADGGSYERDAAIGGYDRKELRGLSKQAKRGTLTQRERARYNYLKDERGGRRKRGLLSGLGGAGAVLAGLAASGKLGGGGGEGGAGLMDLIKARMRGSQEKNLLKNLSKDSIEAATSGDIPAYGNYDPMSEIQDIPLREENVEGAYDEGESSNMQLPDGLPFQGRSEGGPPVRGGMAPSAPEPEGRSNTPDNHVEQAMLEMARDEASRVTQGEGEEGSMTIENPATGPVRRDIEFAPADRVTEPLAGNEERRFRGGPPVAFGGEGSNSGMTAEGFRSSEINIDPEGLADPQYEGSAEKMLEVLNNSRQELGLDPVERLTSEALRETKRTETPKRINPRQPGQIQTNRPEKNLPQLEASEQLRHFFGNRYN